MLFFLPHMLSAAVFTAVASGDWSSALTWGGNAPGANITAADQIIIDPGVTVNLDVDVVLNNQLALMTLLGTIQSTNHQLTVTAGIIAGTGDLIVKHITVGAMGTIIATGNVVVGVLETSSTALLLSTDLHVQTELKISAGVFTLANTGSLLLDAGATIELAGGSFLADTSLIHAAAAINLIYSGPTQTTGSETTIGAIANLSLSLATPSDSLKLDGSLTVSDTLSLQTGHLVLSNHNLTLQGSMQNTAQAFITGSATSGLFLDGTGNVSLVFSSSGAMLDTLVVSQMNGNVTLNSDLTIGASVDLQQGSLLLNGNNLTVNGAVSTLAMASITGSVTSGLTLGGNADVSLFFAPNGNVLDTLTFNQLNSNIVLHSDLTVEGSVDLQQGNLVLNGNDLTVHGSLSTGIGATLSGSASSGLILDGTGNVSLSFDQNGSILDTLVVSQTNGNVSLNADLLVGGSVDLQQGSLLLNGQNLTVNGTLATVAGASITGSATSGLTLNGVGNTSLIFAQNGAMLDTLIVSQANGNVTLDSDLTVNGSIDLQQGSLVLNDANLTVNGSLTTMAGASLTGSSTAGLILNGMGNLSPVFSPNGALLATLVVNQSNGNVALSSDLTVVDSLHLAQGTLDLNGHSLTVNGSFTSIAGTTLAGGATSSLILDGTGNVSLVFAQNASSLDSLVVSQSNGNVTLNADLTITTNVDLQQGSLDLNGNTLTINGSIHTNSGASITGSLTSGLALNGQGNASVIFTPNAALLDAFVVNQTNGNVLLTSDLTVDGSLDLQQGSLVLNGGNLTINGSLSTALGASITGSATSGLILQGTGNLSPVFSMNGAMLDTFIVNQTNGNVILASNLTVEEFVDLQQGALVLNDQHLTVNGALTTAVGASITGSASSGLTLAGTGDVSLVFSQNGSLLNTFMVQQTGGNVTLNSDLTVGGNLNLDAGNLVLNGNDLTINGIMTTTTNATITGSATSTLTLDGTGNASLEFSPNGAILNSLVVSQTNGNVMLNSGLTVEGSIDLQQGSLVLSNGNLTVNGSLSTAVGASLTGNASAGLVLQGMGNISPVFAQNSGLLDTLVVNQSNGNVILASNLTVGNTVDILQGSLVLNGNQLTVNGALNTSAGASITGSSTSGLIFDGTSDVSVVFAPNSSLLGTFTVSQLNGNVTLNEDLSVNNSVTMHQGNLVLNGHNLTSNGSFTTIAGATITGSATSGLTLNGTGNAPIAFSTNGALLDSLVVSQSNGNVLLNSDLTVGSNLFLQQGALALNGNDLTLTGTLSAQAGSTITGSTTSGLFLDGTGDISLAFTQNSALLDTFVVSQTNGNVTLTSNLAVGGNVDLQQGSLVLNGFDLTINGSLVTAVGASITGNAASGLLLDGTTNVSLIFSPNGAILEDLLVSQSNGNVSLNSDLTVGGHVTLQQGSLVLNNHNLTVNGALSTAVGASITGSGNSGLILDGLGNVTLFFAPNSAVLDTLVVSQAGGNVTLTSDLSVGGNLNLQQGSLILDGNDLTVQGTFTNSPGATITGSSTSGLILDGHGNVTLLFSPIGALLDTLVVSQTNGFVSLTTDLTVGKMIDLQEGTLVLNGNDLIVNGTLVTAAGASITGSPFSSLILDGTTDVSLFFAPNSAFLSAFIVSQSNGNVTLNSDLAVSNNVNLQQGSLVLNGNDLIVNGTLVTAAGASITGSVTSGLVLNGTGNVELDFAPNGAVLNSLVVSQMNGNVALNNDLLIEGTLNLEQGKLVLGDQNVTLSNTAQIMGGSPTSYVVTDGNGVLSAFVEAGGAGVSFPCGSTSGYFPAIIAQGSGASDTHIQVKVDNGVLADGTTGTDLTTTESLVNHTWFVSDADANAQLDLNFKFYWNIAAEVNSFDRGACFISHFVNGAWDSNVVAQSTVEANGYFSISRDNIASLSPFRVADATSSAATEVVLRDFQIFPNPVSEDSPVTLRLDSPKADKVQIQVLNTAGQLLRTEIVSLVTGSNDYVLPTANLNAGLYFVEIRGEDQQRSVVRRFVKM